MSYLPVNLRDQLIEIDNHHCAYCYTTEASTGQPMTVDHIIPQAEGGKTEFENLCFSCRRCNEFKGSAISARDPLTGELATLFHPQRQNWTNHFRWDGSGTKIIGITNIGRATIVALNMNNPLIMDARHRWVSVGWHPPTSIFPNLDEPEPIRNR